MNVSSVERVVRGAEEVDVGLCGRVVINAGRVMVVVADTVVDREIIPRLQREPREGLVHRPPLHRVVKRQVAEGDSVGIQVLSLGL